MIKKIQPVKSLMLSIFSVATAASSQQYRKPQKPSTSQPVGETQQKLRSAQGDEPIKLVVADEPDGYRVPDATTATRTDTPLHDIPASIKVVPRQVLQDQGALRVQDAVQISLTLTPPHTLMLHDILIHLSSKVLPFSTVKQIVLNLHETLQIYAFSCLAHFSIGSLMLLHPLFIALSCNICLAVGVNTI